MRGRLFTLLLAGSAVSGCLSLLAPDVERAVGAHAGIRETTAPAVCLGCHRSEPAEPRALPEPEAMAMQLAPGVPAWMLQERAGECMACHGVAP